MQIQVQLSKIIKLSVQTPPIRIRFIYYSKAPIRKAKFLRTHRKNRLRISLKSI